MLRVLSCLCFAGLVAGCAISEDPKLIAGDEPSDQNTGGAGGSVLTDDSSRTDAAPEADAPYDAAPGADARADVGLDAGPDVVDASSEDARRPPDADAFIADARPDVAPEAAPDAPPDVATETKPSFDAPPDVPPEVIRDAGPDVVEACVMNACGGCTTLVGQPNAPCGRCGHWSCSGNDAVVCNDPGYVRVRSIAAGAAHTCALMANGGVRCWGYNHNFQRGDTDLLDHPTPPATDLVTGVQALAAGWFHTCVLRAGGAMQCWGYNEFGDLGDGSGIDRSAADNALAMLPPVRSMGFGNVHACVVLTSGGVRCWGANGEGQLGYTTLNNLPNRTPPAVDTLSGAQAVVASKHTCALTTSGGVRCWGLNDHGQLGFAGSGGSMIPTVDAFTGAVAITVGDSHTCALTTTGGVRCWGANGSGQLGNGTGLDLSTPSGEVLTGVASISAGFLHTCALLTTGAVRCWGDNQHGSVGDGNFPNDRSSPSPDVLTGVEAISTGGGHSCAIMTAGGVQCWGQNEAGQLGHGDLIDHPTPVEALGLGTICP